MKFKKLEAGTKINSLTVLGNYVCCKNKSNRSLVKWECLCSCGNKTWVISTSLHTGRTKSCGCLPKKTRLSAKEADLNGRYRSYKDAAKQRSLSWNLTKQQFEAIGSAPCFYCGAEAPFRKFRNSSKNYGMKFNGIDRYDNSKGYDSNNCVSCCSVHNRMKGNLSAVEFIKLCETVVTHLKGVTC